MRLLKSSTLWSLSVMLLLSCASEQQQLEQAGPNASANQTANGNAANSIGNNAVNAEGQSENAANQGNAVNGAEVNNATEEEDGGGNAAAGENSDIQEEDNLLGEVSNEAPATDANIPENPATPPANIASNTATQNKPTNAAAGQGESAAGMLQPVGDDGAVAQEPGMIVPPQDGGLVAEEQPPMGAPEDVRPAIHGMLSWVGYKLDRKEKQLKIEIVTRGRPQYEVFLEKNRAEQPELVVRFFETSLRPKMRRDIDASEFKSPVSYVRMREDAGNRQTDVVITTRDPLKPRLFAKDGNLLLTYDVPTKYLGTQEELQAQVVGQAVPLAGLMPDLESGSDAPARVATADVLVAFPDPTQGTLQGADSGGQSIDEAIGAEQKTDKDGLPGSFGVEEELAPVEEATPAIESDGQEFEFKPDGASIMSIDGFKFVIVRALSVGAVAAAVSASAARLPNAPSFSPAAYCYEHTCLAQLDAAMPAADGGASDGGAANDAGLGMPIEPGQAPNQGDIEGQEQEAGGGEQKAFSGRPIAIEFFNTPLREVLNVISAESGNNFVYKDTVGGINITIRLRNVPWDEALNAVLETYGLGMARVGPNIIRVDTLRDLVSSLEQINQSKKVEALSAPSKLMTVRLSHAKASTISNLVQSILQTAIQAATADLQQQGSRNTFNLSVVADDRTNSLVVQAPVSFLARAKALIERLDVETPQIEIASRIVEVNRNGSDFFGFALGTGLNYDPGRALSFGSLNFPNSFRAGFATDPGVQLSKASSTTMLTFGSINNFINLDAVLKTEESRGNSNILQSNRVVVLDRQKATITSGTSQYFRRLADTVSSQTAAQTSAGGTAAGAAATSGGIDKVDFNLSLDVTPEVAADGLITMQVAVATSNPTVPDSGQAAASSSRSVNTRMALRSSDTAVIGGIYDTKKTSQVTGIPWLMDIPILGALFRSTSRTEMQLELLVFLTPTLVTPGQQKAQSSDFEKEAAISSPVASNQALNQSQGENTSNSNENINAASGNITNGGNAVAAPVNQGNAPANSGGDNTFDDSANAPQEGGANEAI